MAANASLAHGQERPLGARPRPGVAPSLALGVMLARRGPLAVVSMAVSAVTTLGMAIVALALARRGGDSPLTSVPELASGALAWGGGFLQAVAVSVGALRRDRAEGVRHLLVSRTRSELRYLLARVGGLAAVLAVIVGGGTLIVSVVAMLATARPAALPRLLQATLASVVYAVGYAAVIAPVAFATLGARTRSSGYLLLLLVLVLPELLASTVLGRLPREVSELCSIPSALSVLRSSLEPGGADVLALCRAVVAALAFAAVALMFVWRDVRRGAEDDG